MLYLVESRPTIEQGNKVDAGEGPGPIVAKIVERFRPQAVYGNPSRRQIIMVVNLDTPAEMAELMYALTWFTSNEPTWVPRYMPRRSPTRSGFYRRRHRRLNAICLAPRPPRRGRGELYGK